MGMKFSQLPIASSVASDDYIAVLDSSESVLKRTAINHASQGTAYGLGTTTEYGHNKIIDNLSQSSLVSGESLSARQGNVIANDMGQVELTTTAAYAHSQGDYFILIGQFVKCIQDISVGDTINLGTNVEATSIGAVLGQLNSKIGDTDISSVGSTVTGAISKLGNAEVIARASANSYSTYTAALTGPIKDGIDNILSKSNIYYNGRAILCIGYGIFRMEDQLGYFTCPMKSGSRMYLSYVNVFSTAQTYLGLYTDFTNSTSGMENYSSLAQSQDIVLYLV